MENTLRSPNNRIPGVVQSPKGANNSGLIGFRFASSTLSNNMNNTSGDPISSALKDLKDNYE